MKRYYALTVPEAPAEKTVVDINAVDYLPFGDDNLFPQALIVLLRNSSAHRAIINNKTIYTIGDGFTSADQRTYDWMQEVNPDQALDDVFDRLAMDFYSFGNAYLELVSDRKGSFLNMFHKDASNLRYNRDRDALLYHPDWAKYLQGKRYMKAYPVYPNWGKVEGSDYLRSIVHFKAYEPGSKMYGIPQYIAGLNAAGILYKTDKWNLSRLDNSFKSSGVLIVDGVESDDDAEKITKDFKDHFTGEGNTGKVFPIFKQMGGENTQFISLNDNYTGDWEGLHKQAEADIITAHNWFRALSGVADNTGFDTQRILNEYEIAKNTVIMRVQRMFTRKIGMIINKYLGLDPDIQIMSRPPLSIAGLLNVNKVTRIWEAREMLGLEYDAEDLDQQKYVDNGGAVNNTSGDNRPSNS